MSASTAITYSVEAFNLSHASENKIHDDTVARQFGFVGGLVPGVEVYAYATHPIVQQWGRAWLERGEMECRFLKPVYDGRVAVATAKPEADALVLDVQSEGALCATGRASLAASSQAAPALEAYRAPVPPAERPPADPKTLAVGTWLSTAPLKLTPEIARQYLSDVRERHAIYQQERLAHPGWLLRLCNSTLKENVLLPPWVHVGSKVRNFGVGKVGDTFTARARVVDNYERKGHRLVDVDVILVVNDADVIARVLHTAIYQLRQPAAA